MRLGIDIEQVSRFRRKIVTTPHLLTKLFTEREREYCDRFADTAPHYAARFCAKVAFRKAVDQSVHWLDIEVINESSGQPVFRVRRDALTLITGSPVAVSLSHTGDYATAAVIILEI